MAGKPGQSRCKSLEGAIDVPRRPSFVSSKSFDQDKAALLLFQYLLITHKRKSVANHSKLSRSVSDNEASVRTASTFKRTLFNDSLSSTDILLVDTLGDVPAALPTISEHSSMSTINGTAVSHPERSDLNEILENTVLSQPSDNAAFHSPEDPPPSASIAAVIPQVVDINHPKSMSGFLSLRKFFASLAVNQKKKTKGKDAESKKPSKQSKSKDDFLSLDYAPRDQPLTTNNSSWATYPGNCSRDRAWNGVLSPKQTLANDNNEALEEPILSNNASIGTTITTDNHVKLRKSGSLRSSDSFLKRVQSFAKRCSRIKKRTEKDTHAAFDCPSPSGHPLSTQFDGAMLPSENEFSTSLHNDTASFAAEHHPARDATIYFPPSDPTLAYSEFRYIDDDLLSPLSIDDTNINERRPVEDGLIQFLGSHQAPEEPTHNAKSIVSNDLPVEPAVNSHSAEHVTDCSGFPFTNTHFENRTSIEQSQIYNYIAEQLMALPNGSSQEDNVLASVKANLLEMGLDLDDRDYDPYIDDNNNGGETNISSRLLHLANTLDGGGPAGRSDGTACSSSTVAARPTAPGTEQQLSLLATAASEALTAVNLASTAETAILNVCRHCPIPAPLTLSMLCHYCAQGLYSAWQLVRHNCNPVVDGLRLRAQLAVDVIRHYWQVRPPTEAEHFVQAGCVLRQFCDDSDADSRGDPSCSRDSAHHDHTDHADRPSSQHHSQ